MNVFYHFSNLATKPIWLFCRKFECHYQNVVVFVDPVECNECLRYDLYQWTIVNLTVVQWFRYGCLSLTFVIVFLFRLINWIKWETEERKKYAYTLRAFSLQDKMIWKFATYCSNIPWWVQNKKSKIENWKRWLQVLRYNENNYSNDDDDDGDDDDVEREKKKRYIWIKKNLKKANKSLKII